MKDVIQKTSLAAALALSLSVDAVPRAIPGLGALVTVGPEGQWLVLDSQSRHGAEGRRIPRLQSFKKLLADKKALSTQRPSKLFPISTLQLPLPSTSIRSLGIGLSYQDHRDDVKIQKTVVFEKNATPTRLSDAIPFRQGLDYETEVSLLLHRSEPALFGYLLHNDLTDRRIQVFEFDKKNPAPGFSKSKSFAHANAHGVLMAIGDASLWETLSATLYVNGRAHQRLATTNNVLTPPEIHRMIFSDPKLSGNAEWVIVGTGTPSGTIFRAPSKLEEAYLFLRSGFSVKRARERWLAKFDFLAPGDTLDFRSELLGEFTAEVRTFDSGRE